MKFTLKYLFKIYHSTDCEARQATTFSKCDSSLIVKDWYNCVDLGTLDSNKYNITVPRGQRNVVL